MTDSVPAPQPTATTKPTATATKKCYESCINRLKQEELFPLIQKHPKLIVAWINQSASKTGSIDTQNSFLNALLWHMRAEMPTTDLTVYMEESKRLQVLRREKAKKQILPEAKMEQMMDWVAVTDLEGEAKKELTPDDYLIYSFYTLMPPLRADFHDLMIHKREVANRTGNYILSSKSDGKWRLVLQDYKTSKTYGKQTIDLPLQLVLRIKSAVEASKTAKDGVLRYMSANTLSKRVSAIFEKLCNKPSMTINLLRHSFIKHFLETKRSIAEKERMARRMLHSKTLQECYDVIQTNSASGSVASAEEPDTPLADAVADAEPEHSLEFLA